MIVIYIIYETILGKRGKGVRFLRCVV